MKKKRKTVPIETGAGKAAFRAIKEGLTWEEAEQRWLKKGKHRFWIKQAKREWDFSQ